MTSIRIERVADYAFVIACVAVVALVLQRQMPGLQTRPQLLGPGEIISTVPGVSFGAARRTALLVVNQSCKFCALSMPFYKQLSDRRKGGDTSFQFAAMSPQDDDETVKKYLAEHDVTVDRGLHLALTRVTDVGTPALLVVDSQGRVVASWLGLLSGAQQQEVDAALRSGG